jgi:hypothetical protein
MKTLSKVIGGIILGLLLVVIPATIVMAETEGDWEFTVANGAVQITGYTGTSAIWTIPEKIDGMNVTSIAASAFRGNQLVEELTIPRYMLTVGVYAFENCSALTTINFNATHCNEMDGACVFKDSNSIKTINIGKNVGYLPWGSFDGTAVEFVEIPDSVTEIASYAFHKCEKLKSVKLGKKVTDIGERAFSDCTILEKVTLGNKVVSLGASVFENCSSLKKIIIPDTVVKMRNNMFNGCTDLKKIRFVTTKDFDIINTFFLTEDTKAVLYCIKGSVVDKYADWFDIDVKYILSKPSIKLASKAEKVTVSWNKVTGATGYEVYRAVKKNGAYTLAGTVKGNKNVSYTDSDVETGKKYYYKVMAVSSKDDYLYSLYSSQKNIVVVK